MNAIEYLYKFINENLSEKVPEPTPKEPIELKENERYCPKCGEVLNNTDFYKTGGWCKKCVRIKQRESYKSRKENKNERFRNL